MVPMTEPLPPTIDSLGLGSAIISFTNEWSQRTQIKVSLELDQKLGRLPESTELTIFRIIQESLRNITKHAHAKSVMVLLKQSTSRTILISIIDDGIGLPKDFSLSSLASKKHYGLLGISERVALLGGHLSMQNHTEGGMILQVEIPHPRSRHGAATHKNSA